MAILQPAARRARGTALLALGAFVVHQASYLLAGGGGGAVGQQRHGYLELLAPALVVATLTAICVSLLAAALARRTSGALRPECTTERAAFYALGLLAVYGCQELAEGLVVAGHGSLVAGIFGGAGWFAPPLAIAIGALAAFAQRWLDRAELVIATLLADSPRRAPRRIGSPRAAHGTPLSTLSLAFGLSRRPPPAPLTG